MVDALVWQAALPVPGFEVTDAPMNIPMLVIIFRRLPAVIGTEFGLPK